MGHLKLGRDPKKGEIIALLLVLGFNLLIAVPVIIIGLIIEYTVGAPSIVVVILSAVMMLGDLIPVLLSGIIAYVLLSETYEKWGITIASFIVTGVLLLLVGLDTMGWLQPATPFIVDMIGSYIGAQFMFIVMFVALAICIGKINPNKETNELQKQPKRDFSNYSTESGLKLLVGLGKRIINDSDDEAFQALKKIYFTNMFSKKVLDQSAKEIDFDIDTSLSRDDIEYGRQSFEVFNERFGKLKRWAYYLCSTFLVLSIISAALLVLFISNGVFMGVILFGPAIMLPIIALFIYQFTARYEHSRYSPPLVSQYNSFLFTEREFRKRLIYERGLLSLVFLSLFGIITSSILGQIPSARVWMIISGLVLIIASALSTKDRILKSERLRIDDVVERGLKFIGLSEIENDQETLIEQPSVISDREFPETLERGPIEQDWRKQLEQRGHTEFAKRVANHEREVYLETRDTLYYLAPGAIFVFMGIVTYFMPLDFEFLGFMSIFSYGLIIVGSPFMIYGIVRYLKAYSTTRFHKLPRKQLTLLFTHLDIAVQEVSNFGSMTGINGPSEYINFGLVQIFISTIVRSAIIRLRNYISFPKEEIEKIWKTRSSYPKFESIGFIGSMVVLILVYRIVIPSMSPYLPYLFGLFFIGLIAFFVLTMVYAIILYYREKSQLIEIINSQRDSTDVTYLETLDSLFSLIQSEFALPIRVLFIGHYPQATYTGRSLFTTTGIELKEAVIIPQGMLTGS